MDDTTRDESSPVEPDSDAAQEPEHTDGRRADAAPVREGIRDESSEVTAPALPSEPPAAPDRAQEAASQIPPAAGGQPGERRSRYRSHVRAVVPLLLAGLIGGGIAAGITVIVGAADGDSTTTVIREVSPSPAELTSLDPQPPASETDAQPSADETRGLEPLSVQEIYELASPAVVQITTSIDRDGTGSFEPLIPRRGLGSGFVIDKEGHIVTNFHVIDGASSVRVAFSDGDGVLAKIVGSDPVHRYRAAPGRSRRPRALAAAPRWIPTRSRPGSWLSPSGTRSVSTALSRPASSVPCSGRSERPAASGSRA